MAKSPEPPKPRLLEEAPASLSRPLPREKLPHDLQSIVDKQDDVWEDIYDGQYALSHPFQKICFVKFDAEPPTQPTRTSGTRPTPTAPAR
jgi:hypothetical protein